MSEIHNSLVWVPIAFGGSHALTLGRRVSHSWLILVPARTKSLMVFWMQCSIDNSHARVVHLVVA